MDSDGGLAAVVDDPVVAEDAGHPAAVEVHVDEQLGLDGWIVGGVRTRCVARRQYRDAGIRTEGAMRPDVDPAAARQIHPRRAIARAAAHWTMDRDDMLAVAVLVEGGNTVHIAGHDPAYPDARGARAAGIDPALGTDHDTARVVGIEVLSHDAVGVGACRGDGGAASRVDHDFADAGMPPKYPVGIVPLCRDRAPMHVDE